MENENRTKLWIEIDKEVASLLKIIFNGNILKVGWIWALPANGDRAGCCFPTYRGSPTGWPVPHCPYFFQDPRERDSLNHAINIIVGQHNYIKVQYKQISHWKLQSVS